LVADVFDLDALISGWLETPATNAPEPATNNEMRIEINPQKIAGGKTEYYMRYRRGSGKNRNGNYTYIGKADEAAQRLGGRIARRWHDYQARQTA